MIVLIIIIYLSISLCQGLNLTVFSADITGLRNILPITTAKVPIVKFEHRQSGLEGDISLYNTLVSVSRSCLQCSIKCLNVPFFLLTLLNDLLWTGRLCRLNTTLGCWLRMQHWIQGCNSWDIQWRSSLRWSYSSLRMPVNCFHIASCCVTHFPLCSQRCDIGDASRGSLSSYAYILMVLYFLQQRQPPVIPVLQEVSVAD